MRKLLALSAMACLTTIHAAPLGAYSLAAGTADGTERVTAAWVLEPRELNYTFSLVPELGVSYWHGAVSAWQVHASPMFQVQLSSKFYAEAGVGASYFTRTNFVRSNINTHFQFADQLGVGYSFGQSAVSVRVEHFSNGGIKNPNPGVNMVQLVYMHHL